MYIVTGGAGFIGSAVVWRLNRVGIDDILVVDCLGETDKWKNLINRQYTDYINKTIFLSELMNERFGKIDAIIHMGACSSTTEIDADYLIENNFHYSVQLAEYALKHNIRFVYASSAATYGDGQNGFSDDIETMIKLKPLNMYGYSKQLFDVWVLKNKCIDRFAGLKFFNVFGPNEYHKGDMSSVIFKAFQQIKEFGKLKLFKSYRKLFDHGEQKRDFVYVKNCAELIWWLLENPDINDIFNVGVGKARTWNDLAKSVFNAMGLKVNIEYIDMPERLKDRYQYYTCADIQKLKAAGCQVQFADLKCAADDYIKNYLSQDDTYL